MSIYYNENYSDKYFNESIIDDVKTYAGNLKDLFDQYRKIAGTFVTHKWIQRYINAATKEQISKHYDVICDEKTTYSVYKRSFEFIRKFMGISGNVIIENIVFSNDKKDKDLFKVAIKYSKGLAKIKIPKGVRLIHVSPVAGITELIPSFRSKVKGKYLYPAKRCFFTIMKDIKVNQAGLENKKLYRYCTVDDISEAYIDPTYNDFGSRAIYLETDKPIRVMPFEKKMFNLFGKNESAVEYLYDGKYFRENEALKEFFLDNKETKEIIKTLIPRESVSQSKNSFSSSLDEDEYKEIKEIFNVLHNAEEYKDYKKAFEKLCKFCHIAPNGTIITKHTITGNDKDGYKLDIEYSYNNKKVTLPDNVALYHMSKVDNISTLEPQFRGKSEKGYLYYKPRIYFTIKKDMPKISADINPLSNNKTHTYICMKNIKDVYVDPLLNASLNGAVYIETYAKIPVKKIS